MIRRFHVRWGNCGELDTSEVLSATVVVWDLGGAPASGLGATGIGMGTACCGWLVDDDWALKAAAMAMAPLMPVPATRQITVE